MKFLIECVVPFAVGCAPLPGSGHPDAPQGPVCDPPAMLPPFWGLFGVLGALLQPSASREGRGQLGGGSLVAGIPG